MPRPTKQGIDYFPLDCHFDPKTEMYIVETEGDGLAVLITIWQLIYQNEGYYIIHDIDLPLLIKKRINVDIKLINDYINVALRRGIFSNSKHEEYNILTSKAVQTRFFDIAKRKKEVLIINKYVIEDVEFPLNGVNVNGNPVNVTENTIKETKLKETKLKKTNTILKDTSTTNKENRSYPQNQEPEEFRSSINKRFEKKKQFIRDNLKNKTFKPTEKDREPKVITSKELDRLFEKKQIDLILKYYFYTVSKKPKHFASYFIYALENKFTIPDHLEDEIKLKIKRIA